MKENDYIHMRIDKELKRKLKVKLAQKNMTITGLIKVLVTEWYKTK